MHIHSSDDPSPSADDIEFTTRLVRVGELVGIDVLDHVVVTCGATRYVTSGVTCGVAFDDDAVHMIACKQRIYS